MFDEYLLFLRKYKTVSECHMTFSIYMVYHCPNNWPNQGLREIFTFYSGHIDDMHSVWKDPGESKAFLKPVIISLKNSKGPIQYMESIRSCDLKMSVTFPVHQIYRYVRFQTFSY